VLLVGGFQVLRGTRPIVLPATAQRVIAFLTLGERPVERSRLAGTLWPEGDESRAGANLRSALWRIRKEDGGLVSTDGAYVAIGRSVSSDVRDGMALARRLADPSVPVGGDELERIDLFAELLPNWYDEWTAPWRQRYDQVRVHALESMCVRLASLGLFERSVEVGLVAVAVQPLRESAHEALIRAHVAEGNRGEAILQYRACRDVLRRELGIEPSHELQELLEHLLAG
jgi:DNA-binding SARP family transcriptional activator